MELECIVTQANGRARIRFLAMERSLRATGCELPIRVIPYDEDRFELPPNSSWWEDDELGDYLARNGGHPGMRKYRCLTIANFQFVDTDVVFVRNPSEALRPASGWVTCCGHWHNPDQTLTSVTRPFFSDRSTIWQQEVFNGGQWASDTALFTSDTLREMLERPDIRSVVLEWRHNEQPGLNLLRLLSGVPVTNLTLSPHRLESSWAGDYPGEFERYWIDGRSPYLIHWAGISIAESRPIDRLFLDLLTADERVEIQGETWRGSRGDSSWRKTVRAARRLLSARSGIDG